MRIGSLLVLLFTILLRPAAAVPVEDLVISEVLYDAAGSDAGLEWVELFNGSGSTIDLSLWSLGWGGASYADATTDLAGAIGVGQYFVAGGPNSSTRNGSPVFDLVLNFSPDLQNAGSVADGIGLFDRLAASIDSATAPFFSVVYGAVNSNLLIGANRQPGQPDVADARSGSSIEYLGASIWQVQADPTPGSGSLQATGAIEQSLPVSEPGMLGLMLAASIAWRLSVRSGVGGFNAGSAPLA